MQESRETDLSIIQQQLRELPYDCTKIIIAQRISSVKEADEILILKDGAIAERGTHEELLKVRGYYWETFCLQNGIELTSEVGHQPDERQPMQALAERSLLQPERLEKAEAKEAK